MTPERQQIAIAEIQGIHVCPGCYHEIDPDCCHCGSPMKSHGYNVGHSGVPMGCTCGYDKADEMKASEPECPNYPSDLNAMHEAEKTLTGQQTVEYVLALRLIIETADDLRTVHWFAVVRATAAQRAEAFLRTLGLWTCHLRPSSNER